MKIIKDFTKVNKEFQNTVLALGNFDGVHLGHQTILNDIKKIAQDYKTKSALLTFEPHPIKVLNPKKAQNIRLQNLGKKLRFLKNNNLVDVIFLANFTKELAELEAHDFVKNILVDALKIKHLAVGYDFCFGKDRKGDSELLKKLSKEYGFGFTKIEAKFDQNNEIYSSTKIRKLISEGKIKKANQILGRPYEVSGFVIKGKQMARNLGFPTANFLPKNHLIQPKFGVYQALVNDSHKAVLNFGVKPTLNEENQPLFEVHIFDFNQDLYGKKIKVKLLDFIREEKKFSSLEELKNQIKKDCERAKN